MHAILSAGATSNLETLKGTRGTTDETLRAAMSWLIRILDGALSGIDPRGTSFGLHVPAQNQTPGQPQNVTAFVTSGEIFVNCGAVSLATRYRWRKKVVGVDEEFSLAKSSLPPDAIIGGTRRGTRSICWCRRRTEICRG
jgi:hypothetical protein